MIATRGLEATRVEDVTHTADLGKGAFYNYFASKDALFAALLSEAVEQLDRTYLSDVALETSRAERVKQLCRRHEAFFAANPVSLLLLHQLRSLLLRGGGQGGLAAIFRGYLSRVASLLEGGAAAPSQDAVDQAATLVGAITGYHSFRIAAGLQPTHGAVEQLLSRGLHAATAGA